MNLTIVITNKTKVSFQNNLLLLISFGHMFLKIIHCKILGRHLPNEVFFFTYDWQR